MLVTKWKTYSKKFVTKASAFILIIAFFLIGASSALNIYLNVKNYESITVKSYMESNTLSNELRYAANRLEHVLRVYKNEDYIINGGTVRNLDIEDSWQLKNLYNNFLAEQGLEDNSDSRYLFWTEKEKEINEIKNLIIKTDLSNYEQIMNTLNEPGGLIYYATDGKYNVTNTNNYSREYYDTQHVYILIDKQGMKLMPQNGYNNYSASLLDAFEDIEGGRNKTFIYAAITEDGLLKRAAKWNEDRSTLISNTAVIVLAVIFVLACFIYLIAVTGKVPSPSAEDQADIETQRVKMFPIDKMYADLSLAVITGIVAVSIIQFYNVLNIRYTNVNLMRFVMLSMSAIFASVFITLFLSIVRHIKNSTLIRHTLIYEILSRAAKAAVAVVARGPLMIKAMAAVVLSMGVTYYTATKSPVLLIPIVFGACYYVFTKVKKFQTIQEGFNIARSGDYDYKISLEGKGEFNDLAENMNDITSGLKIAVQNEVKSERLKTELITNVSHDIKTPLTSIISYVDLLKREGLSSPNAPKYLDVLDRKSNRLKTLTEDLFEAAKATSGAIEVKYEKVNVNALISQILGELDEKIQESNLSFKVSKKENRIFAKADGRLLSRVMENLLSNIFKYALEDSRVYIDIWQTEKEVFVSFKNISAVELNIPVDELMERFKRGDESRSSEGNGLGLAIAKSLMEIQEGLLSISIDGDLFKAEIKLNRYV